MQNPGIYISELLAEHDCVIVPGFGGFVARPAPAHFAKAGNLLLPPGKSLVFNKNLDKSDGLLVSHIASKEGISYREAAEQVEKWVLASARQLSAQRRLELERTGILYYSEENNLLFEPSVNSNHQLESFGLAPVSAMPLEPAETAKPETPVTYREPARTVRSKMVTRISVAVSSVLLFAFLLFLTADQLPVRKAIASLNPFAPKEEAYQLRTYELGALFSPSPARITTPVRVNSAIRISETSGRTFIVASDSVETDKTKVYKNVKPVVSGSNFNAPFQIVVGCFAVEKNAQRLIAQLQAENIPAGIAGQNARGLYVVSLAGFTTESMARAKLGQVKQRFPSAWIMLK
jgi:hypothetical protein